MPSFAAGLGADFGTRVRRCATHGTRVKLLLYKDLRCRNSFWVPFSLAGEFVLKILARIQFPLEDRFDGTTHPIRHRLRF